MDCIGRVGRRQGHHAFCGQGSGRRTSKKRIAGGFLFRRKRPAVGPTQPVEGLPGLLRSVFHRDRPVLDPQRLGLRDQRVRRRQVVFLHRLTSPPQQVRRLLPPIVGGGIGSCSIGLGKACGAEKENGVAGPRRDPIGGETQQGGQPAGQDECGRFQHGSPLLFKRSYSAVRQTVGETAQANAYDELNENLYEEERLNTRPAPAGQGQFYRIPRKRGGLVSPSRFFAAHSPPWKKGEFREEKQTCGRGNLSRRKNRSTMMASEDFVALASVFGVA